MIARPAPAAAPAILEASARLSWHGADVTLTVRADDPALLARRLDRALAALGAAAAAPALEPVTLHAHAAQTGAHAAPQPPAHAGPPPPPLCAVHGAPLTWRTPKGGGAGWWSHRTPEGAWCRG